MTTSTSGFCTRSFSWGVHAASDAESPPELAECVAKEVIARSVMETGDSVVVRDARADVPHGTVPSVRAQSLRSICCVPVTWDGEVRAALYLDHASTAGLFGARDVRSLVSFACVLGMAVDSACLWLQGSRSSGQSEDSEFQTDRSEETVGVGPAERSD